MTTDANNGATPQPGARTQLSRDLSCFDITMIGVGAMIGAGIFVLTGIAAGTAGPALILAFALNGIVTIFTAMVYAELGSAIPEAGGGYLWIKEGLPGGNAFLAGWMSWFAHAVAGSLYALGFGAYFKLMLGTLGFSFFGLPEDIAEKILGAVIAIAFIYINYRGASETGTIGNVVTIAKVVILGIFVVSGIVAITRRPHAMDSFTPFAPEGLAGVFSAMGLTFIAFEGYEIIVQAGEEVKNPRRNVPRAVFLSLAIVIPIYILVAFAALGAVNPDSGEASWQWLGIHAEVGLVEAAKQFMPFGTTLLLIGGIMSTMSALNATTFSSTRVSFAMGRDQNLPDAFGRISEKRRTPVVALLASGAIIIAMAVAVPIEHVAAAADIMFLLLFLQVNVAVMTIRKKYADKLNYGYLTPFFPAVPILGIACQLLLALFMFHYSALAWYVALGWLAVGWGIWLFYAKPREHTSKATPVAISEHLPTKKDRPRILVPIANPKSAEGLVAFAARQARIEDAEVIALHTVVVPAQVPPSAARSLIRRARPGVQEATEKLERLGARASSLVRVSHSNPWRGILDTVRECDIDMVVMGWRGRSRDPNTVVGKNIDKVLKGADCDVVVLQNPRPEPYKRILVAVANAGRGPLMLRVARLLSTRDGAIDLLHVTNPAMGDPNETIKKMEAVAKEARDADPYGPPIKVINAPSLDPVGEIVTRSKEYDALLIGSTEEGWFRQRVFATATHRIAARTRCPLVLVGPGAGGFKHGIQSFFAFFRDLEAQAKEEEAEVRATPEPKNNHNANDDDTEGEKPADDKEQT